MVNETGLTHRSHILHILRHAGNPLTGDDIGGQVGISRVAVHKHIRALTDAGYPLISSRSGYELGEESRQPFTSWEFLPEEQISVLPRVSSTMNAARQLAAQNPGRDFTLVAETQEEGRGRRHRTWDSPEGGLWATRLFHPEGSSLRLQKYVMAAAASLAVILRERNIDAVLKWPNDVLVDNRKIAGVLAEAGLNGDRFEYLALGIGLNINNPPSKGATALKSLTGQEEDRRVWLRRWIGEFQRLTDSNDFKSDGEPGWWNSLMWGLNDSMSFSVTGSKVVSGTVTGTDGLGRLCIRTKQGTTLHISPGDLEEVPSTDKRSNHER